MENVRRSPRDFAFLQKSYHLMRKQVMCVRKMIIITVVIAVTFIGCLALSKASKPPVISHLVLRETVRLLVTTICSLIRHTSDISIGS